MSKENKVKPGGDKVITWLRLIGDVGESVVSKLLATATLVGIGTLIVRGSTDVRIIYNKRKMKKDER